MTEEKVTPKSVYSLFSTKKQIREFLTRNNVRVVGFRKPLPGELYILTGTHKYSLPGQQSGGLKRDPKADRYDAWKPRLIVERIV